MVHDEDDKVLKMTKAPFFPILKIEQCALEPGNDLGLGNTFQIKKGNMYIKIKNLCKVKKFEDFLNYKKEYAENHDVELSFCSESDKFDLDDYMGIESHKESLELFIIVVL